ncbi:MAG TPA: PASTA domain-containing protein [Thermoanaerobaculia bacterium]|nr:PASTA domain-containing protein [Thermoanaerobaculia bacterium]
MARFAFRLFYGTLLVGVFLGAVWFGFRRAIVGRSVTVPDLTSKTPEEALKAARAVGLQLEEQSGRARYDDRVPRGRVLLQQPEAGSLAKPLQTVRVVLSLGARELRVPELQGLAPRAAAVKLTREALELGPVSWYRDPKAPQGIVAQEPEPDVVAARGQAVSVLTSRGAPETRMVMPDFVGKDAQTVRERLEKFGYRVGSARFETYDGVRPDTILKQFPPAGYPLSSREVVSLTVSRSPDAGAPAPRS